HSAFAHEGHQGSGITRGWFGDGLQADRRRASTLAGRQRPTPGRPRACRSGLPQRQTARATHRYHPAETTVSWRTAHRNGGCLNTPDPQVLTLPPSGPEMLGDVGPPGPPADAVIGQRTYRTAHSELLCGSTKPEIVDRKRIRV